MLKWLKKNPATSSDAEADGYKPSQQEIPPKLKSALFRIIDGQHCMVITNYSPDNTSTIAKYEGIPGVHVGQSAAFMGKIAPREGDKAVFVALDTDQIEEVAHRLGKNLKSEAEEIEALEGKGKDASKKVERIKDLNKIKEAFGFIF